MSRPGVAVLLAAIALAAALVAFLVVEPWLDEPAAMPEEPIVAADVVGAITFELRERNRSGRFGFVTLEPVEGGTRVGIDLGQDGATAHPAHIHAGSCSGPGELLHELNLVLARAGRDDPATSFTTVRTPFEELRAGAQVVDVHASETNDTIIACVSVGE